MLDEYIEEQETTIKILKNAVCKNKVSHAYLFETNEYDKKDQLILAFIKYLLCPFHYSNLDECDNCFQCQNIDNNNFSEIKHIYPNGMWIKKEQLLELQRDFSQTSIQSKKRIYIIHEAEKLNTSASNSILKFLEEPKDNIIAILMTNNIYQLLDTIISRCQIISFKKCCHLENKNLVGRIKQNVEISKELENQDENNLLYKIQKGLEFIEYYESHHIDTILYTKDKFHSFFQNKEDILFFLDVANLFYIESLRYSINQKVKIFLENKNLLFDITKKNTLKQLSKKIEIIIQTKENVKYNVNTDLLIDRFIIEMAGEIV